MNELLVLVFRRSVLCYHAAGHDSYPWTYYSSSISINPVTAESWSWVYIYILIDM